MVREVMQQIRNEQQWQQRAFLSHHQPPMEPEYEAAIPEGSTLDGLENILTIGYRPRRFALNDLTRFYRDKFRFITREMGTANRAFNVDAFCVGGFLQMLEAAFRLRYGQDRDVGGITVCIQQSKAIARPELQDATHWGIVKQLNEANFVVAS